MTNAPTVENEPSPTTHSNRKSFGDFLCALVFATAGPFDVAGVRLLLLVDADVDELFEAMRLLVIADRSMVDGVRVLVFSCSNGRMCWPVLSLRSAIRCDYSSRHRVWQDLQVFQIEDFFELRSFRCVWIRIGLNRFELLGK